MSLPRENFQALLRQASITPDKPLYHVLMAAMDATAAARDAVRGAHGLTPEGEAALIQRVSEAAARATEREAARLVHRADLRLVFRAALVLALVAAAAFWGGVWAAKTGRL